MRWRGSRRTTCRAWPRRPGAARRPPRWRGSLLVALLCLTCCPATACVRLSGATPWHAHPRPCSRRSSSSRLPQVRSGPPQQPTCHPQAVHPRGTCARCRSCRSGVKTPGPGSCRSRPQRAQARARPCNLRRLALLLSVVFHHPQLDLVTYDSGSRLLQRPALPLAPRRAMRAPRRAAMWCSWQPSCRWQSCGDCAKARACPPGGPRRSLLAVWWHTARARRAARSVALPRDGSSTLPLPGPRAAPGHLRMHAPIPSHPERKLHPVQHFIHSYLFYIFCAATSLFKGGELCGGRNVCHHDMMQPGSMTGAAQVLRPVTVRRHGTPFRTAFLSSSWVQGSPRACSNSDTRWQRITKTPSRSLWSAVSRLMQRAMLVKSNSAARGSSQLGAQWPFGSSRLQQTAAARKDCLSAVGATPPGSAAPSARR